MKEGKDFLIKSGLVSFIIVLVTVAFATKSYMFNASLRENTCIIQDYKIIVSPSHCPELHLLLYLNETGELWVKEKNYCDGCPTEIGEVYLEQHNVTCWTAPNDTSVIYLVIRHELVILTILIGALVLMLTAVPMCGIYNKHYGNGGC